MIPARRVPRAPLILSRTYTTSIPQPPIPPPSPLDLAPSPSPSNTYLLRLFRHTLRETDLQFTKINQSPVWRAQIHAQYSSAPSSLLSKTSTPTSTSDEITERNAEDLLTFLRATRVHREMMERYWPGDRMTEMERAEASANRVGLNLPKMLVSRETRLR